VDKEIKKPLSIIQIILHQIQK